MKELEVTIQLRNNRLKQRRLELGFSQKVLAALVEIPLHVYGTLETMRTSPVTRRGEWSTHALKLSAFYEVPVEEIFPESVMNIKDNKATRLVDAIEITSLLAAQEPRLLESPNDELPDREKMKEAIRDALGHLKPRAATVLRMRFGLDDGEPKTLREIGDVLGVGRERIRQIEQQGLRVIKKGKAGALLAEWKEVNEWPCNSSCDMWRSGMVPVEKFHVEQKRIRTTYYPFYVDRTYRTPYKEDEERCWCAASRRRYLWKVGETRACDFTWSKRREKRRGLKESEDASTRAEQQT
jgi:RNA polymerase sigma factor (sigma-70 family)